MDTMSRASRTVTHPLDPLTPAEIETAVAIVRRERALGDDVLFVSVVLIPTFIHDDIPTARQAAREFLVHYARGPHYAKTFATSGYVDEMDQVAKAWAAGDLATAMAALSDTLLDDVVLLGPPSRIREGIDQFARAGVEWITMGPQSVASDSLARQAERMIAALAPR